ncbi:hypothetical protein O3P69_015511 [Scylla paramamosain]|uniref:Uncharacterized protein n=1 Tax=Scylla paramamosain TaxID=85552 RepID=A0AAW0T501_SCYPA
MSGNCSALPFPTPRSGRRSRSQPPSGSETEKFATALEYESQNFIQTRIRGTGGGHRTQEAARRREAPEGDVLAAATVTVILGFGRDPPKMSSSDNLRFSGFVHDPERGPPMSSPGDFNCSGNRACRTAQECLRGAHERVGEHRARILMLRSHLRDARPPWQHHEPPREGTLEKELHGRREASDVTEGFEGLDPGTARPSVRLRRGASTHQRRKEVDAALWESPMTAGVLVVTAAEMVVVVKDRDQQEV